MRQTIRFRCPGCGSDLQTPEGSVSHRCTYCGLTSLLGLPGRIIKQYYPSKIEGAEAKFLAEKHLKDSGQPLFTIIPVVHYLYVPFYRFRGLSLACLSARKQELSPESDLPVVAVRKFELRARNIDVTMLASSQDVAGLTDLGIRPQAVALHAYRDADVPVEATVMPADRAPRDALNAARKMDRANIERANADAAPEFSEIVGEHLALAYFPVYAVSGMTGEAEVTVFVDALARRVYGQRPSQWRVPPLGAPSIEIIDLQPRPHRCPNCGADFAASERSLFYCCSNCARAYMLDATGYRQMLAPLVAAGDGPLYPFWRVAFEFDGRVPCRTVGDFARRLTAEIPLLDKRKTGELFYVYVPAFDGADAEFQVQAGLRFTRTQPLIEPSPRALEPFAPVALSASESSEFAGFVWNWLRMSYLSLRGDEHDFRSASAGTPELLWLPVQDMRLQRSVMRAQGGAVRSARDPVEANRGKPQHAHPHDQ